MAIPDLLRGCPLFKELYDKELEKIVRHCSVYNFKKDDLIVQEGEEGDAIFVILEGDAKVQKTIAGGTIQIQPLSRGDVFGEMVLLDERIRSADVLAVTNCAILELKYGSVFQLFKKEPRIFGILILNLSRLLAQRLRGSNQIIVELGETDLVA